MAKKARLKTLRRTIGRTARAFIKQGRRQDVEKLKPVFYYWQSAANSRRRNPTAFYCPPEQRNELRRYK